MEEMLDIYCANHPLYEDFTNQMQQFVSAVLQKNNIRVQSVTARVKSPASLRQKIISHNKYSQLEDITDLCGLRIITFSKKM
jgi:ppGpp synthetase/RelA/SpoT-type nucleotidyltranferase